MRQFSLFLALSAVPTFGACSAHAPLPPGPTYEEVYLAQRRSGDSLRKAITDSVRRELPRREAQWGAQNISAYRLAIRVGCYCRTPPVAVVTVRGDSSQVHNALGQPLSEFHTQWLAFTVPKLFAELRLALADSGFFVRARFDSIYGFPDFLELSDRRGTHAGYHAHVEAFELLARRSSSSRLRQN